MIQTLVPEPPGEVIKTKFTEMLEIRQDEGGDASDGRLFQGIDNPDVPELQKIRVSGVDFAHPSFPHQRHCPDVKE